MWRKDERLEANLVDPWNKSIRICGRPKSFEPAPPNHHSLFAVFPSEELDALLSHQWNQNNLEFINNNSTEDVLLPSLTATLLGDGGAKRTVYKYKWRCPVSSVAKMNCVSEESQVGRKCKMSWTYCIKIPKPNWYQFRFRSKLQNKYQNNEKLLITLIQLWLWMLHKICGYS